MDAGGPTDARHEVGTGSAQALSALRDPFLPPPVPGRDHLLWCKEAPALDRKTCPTHLAYAKARFRVWAEKRARAGLCLSCERKGYQGECRCLLHKGVN